MPEISQLALHAVIYTLLGTAALFAVVLRNPRLMLNDFPPAVRAAVPPRTAAETREATIWGLPFILILILYPLLAAFLYRAGRVPEPRFLELFLFTWGIGLAFNLWDWLVLDWLLVCTITPRWMIIPGTEGNPGYKDYLFHFRGFLIGTVITLVLGAIAAGIVSLF